MIIYPPKEQELEAETKPSVGETTELLNSLNNAKHHNQFKK